MNNSDITVEVENQLEIFKKGAQKVRVARAAVPGDGILVFDTTEAHNYAQFYDNEKDRIETAKFTPASGAATRMFKDLLAYVETEEPNEAVKRFEKNCKQFPFSRLLEQALKSAGIYRGIEQTGTLEIIKTMLLPGGLAYGSLPKGLIDFHKYPDCTRKPVDEHLVEGALYGSGRNKSGLLHFTVSPAHEMRIRTRIEHMRGEVEAKYGVSLKSEFSYQNPDTDTVAVTPNLKPVTDEAGNILFRAGGHGALLSNLQQLNADVIFIKNIDNVVPETRVEDTVFWKKVLAGKLLKIQKERDQLLKAFDMGALKEKSAVVEFLKRYSGSDRYENASLEELISIIDSPIRVCGMVKNTGAPGGGPFWVADKNGIESLQIVEKTEIDIGEHSQNEILQKSTHFNPVDVVCAIQNHRGEKYDLQKYKDENRFFISEKSFRGKPILALEHPGLWNGAMDKWITLFVEVPETTFNPVKTVFDLLGKVRVVK